MAIRKKDPNTKIKTLITVVEKYSKSTDDFIQNFRLGPDEREALWVMWDQMCQDRIELQLFLKKVKKGG